ncbi:MAG: hypothetical protein IH897_08580 [Planctomycetes bacterium]|nr:hypothetical protein [Planctomycetota bacterium]
MRQFKVRPSCEEEFQRAFGADGDWAKFYRTGPGFVTVELLRDPRDPRMFLTIDRGETATDYGGFSGQNAIQYREIDERCERLPVKETHVGSFKVVGISLGPDNRK